MAASSPSPLPTLAQKCWNLDAATSAPPSASYSKLRLIVMRCRLRCSVGLDLTLLRSEAGNVCPVAEAGRDQGHVDLCVGNVVL